MDFEENFWRLVKDRGRVANFYKNECEALWKNYSPEQQQAICESIEQKLQSDKYVQELMQSGECASKAEAWAKAKERYPRETHA